MATNHGLEVAISPSGIATFPAMGIHVVFLSVNCFLFNFFITNSKPKDATVAVINISGEIIVLVVLAIVESIEIAPIGNAAAPRIKPSNEEIAHTAPTVTIVFTPVPKTVRAAFISCHSFVSLVSLAQASLTLLSLDKARKESVSTATSPFSLAAFSARL